MLKIDFTNSTVTTDSLQNRIPDYLQKIHARKQGFYEILDDTATIEKIKAFQSNHEHIVVLGIGGSSLGAICLQQSLTHLFKTPKLHVIDNIDPILIKELEDVIDPSNTLFIVITKSGTTPEIMAQYEYFRAKAPKENFVFITDPQKGVLKEIAEKEGIPTFDIPENVGGRFSVLTPVGLLPAHLLNIDIDKLIAGAKNMREKFLNESNNLPFNLAATQYLLEQEGKNINVLMPYAQKLIRLADWYRQLLAESIGKKLDNEGNTVNTGITPVNALGVTDQHSQSQLYNEGPNDKLLMFIEVENLGLELQIPGENYSFNKLIQVEKEATAGSLTKNSRPNITIKIPQVDEEALGELFMLFEASIAFLGEFYNINAFDQPGVELSKILTKEMLS